MMERFRVFLLHLCVVCSFVCIIAKVLDWYNPYMDFSNHILFIQVLLYVVIIILAYTRKEESSYKFK